MSNQEIFAIWAPDGSLWSPWVKPVLFSYLDRRRRAPTAFQFDLSWSPRPANTALVVDIPGPESVALGLELAKIGYRPVPLFNSIPLPLDSPEIDPHTLRQMAAVDVISILDPLFDGAAELSKLSLPNNAPPVFLLDSARSGSVTVHPEIFDNRSVSFTTDFPSAKFLLEHGISNALLVTKNAVQPQNDLAHTLRKWQEGGVAIFAKRLNDAQMAEPITIAAPPRFRSMFQRALVALHLRRASTGGFGDWLPDPEGHGGGG
jgi:hypothetical protein